MLRTMLNMIEGRSLNPLRNNLQKSLACLALVSRFASSFQTKLRWSWWSDNRFYPIHADNPSHCKKIRKKMEKKTETTFLGKDNSGEKVGKENVFFLGEKEEQRRKRRQILREKKKRRTILKVFFGILKNFIFSLQSPQHCSKCRWAFTFWTILHKLSWNQCWVHWYMQVQKYACWQPMRKLFQIFMEFPQGEL